MNIIPYQIDIGHAFLDAIRTYDDLYIYIYISVVFVVCSFLSLHTKGLLGGSVKAPFNIKSHCLSKGGLHQKRGRIHPTKKNKNENPKHTPRKRERERERKREKENKKDPYFFHFFPIADVQLN